MRAVAAPRRCRCVCGRLGSDSDGCTGPAYRVEIARETQSCDPRASDRHDRKSAAASPCQSHGRNPPRSGPTEMRPLVINVIFCAGALGFALGIVQAIRSPPMKEQPAKPAEEDRFPAAMTLTPKVVRPQMVRPQIVTPQESPPTIPAAPQTALAPPVMTTPIQAPVSVTTIATADGSGAFIERRHGYDGLCERYHLRREDYTRNGHPYWRCVR